MSVDTSIVDQVWLSLKCVPGVLFGFSYVPPSDSPYFDHSLLSAIQEKLMTTEYNKGCILIGDLNARFGNLVRCLTSENELSESAGGLFSYPSIPDPVAVPTDSAKVLAGLCTDLQLLVVNDLCTPNKNFLSNLTYRQGGRWVSELDTCIASSNLVKYIREFNVTQDLSLPSDHAPISLTLQSPTVCEDSLVFRASHLGDHAVLYSCQNQNELTKKSIKFENIDQAKFLENLSQREQPHFGGDVDVYIDSVTDVLYETSMASRSTTSSGSADVTVCRWERLLRDRNEAQVWQAINWRGEVNLYQGEESVVPTDNQFKEFFEQILNPVDVEEPNLLELQTDVSIPLLDEPISVWEVSQQVKRLKPNKACGPDGLAPGIFKVLPITWLVTVAFLFNCIFSSGCYPLRWATAKLFTIFKRGCRSVVNNYRGISVMNSLAKVYDMILCERLQRWFSPFREQAGCQAGRGCMEHIVALRLVIDLAKRKKMKLYVTFVDFSQAYDKVPRNMLFTVLKRLGCGAIMLGALIAMYRVTNCVIGSAIVSATIGVRQGSPTSCLLFVLFVNDLIHLIKQNCDVDGFLAWLHVLVLMDDTVLLATTRANMIKKIQLLNRFCETHGMKVNMSKTKFFVIGGNNDDVQAIHIDDLVVEHCNQYVYLGSPFTADGLVSSAIKVHAQTKMCHVLKFVSFVSKNNDIPFIVKRKVFDAALISTILYGCESWLGGDLKPVNKLYNWCLKQLLGVRKSTCNNLCLVELGYPPLRALVSHKQRKFFKGMWNERSNMMDDPLVHAINLTLESNTPTSRYVRDLLYNEVDDVGVALDAIKRNISESSSSRMQFYKRINSEFKVHAIYTDGLSVNELERISWTRMRVSAHSLAVETGRWNRRGRGRLPLEERLCTCGQIQTEVHVIEECPRTSFLQNQYSYATLENINEMADCSVVCTIFHRILAEYK